MSKIFQTTSSAIFAAGLLIVATVAQAQNSYSEQLLQETVGDTINSGGDAVAISGEWGFVGDTTECKVHIYKYDYTTNLWGDGGSPAQAAVPYTTIPPTGSCQTANNGGFGASVSASGDLVPLLAVGAPLAKQGGSTRYGRIFFYRFDETQIGNGAGGWVERFSIGEPSDRLGDGTEVLDGQVDSGFGASISIRFDEFGKIGLLVAGAPFYDTPRIAPVNTSAGKVYIYEYDENPTPDVIRFIGAIEGENAGDFFGNAVTSNPSGRQALIGAPGYDLGLHTDLGKVYLWGYDDDLVDPNVNPSSTWESGAVSLDPALTVSDPILLGTSVSLGTTGVLLAGGVSAYVFEDVIPPFTGPFTEQVGGRQDGANGGDVSQSGNVAAFGMKEGTLPEAEVRVFYDHLNIDQEPDWVIKKISPLAEPEWGDDISISDFRVMVNGQSSKVGITNNFAYAYYPSCGLPIGITANEWHMIGMPCDTGLFTVNDLLGDDFVGLPYGTATGKWVVRRQLQDNFTGNSNTYHDLELIDPMQQGIGYWIIFLSDDPTEERLIDFSGSPTPTVAVTDPDDRLVYEFLLFEKTTTNGWIPDPLPVPDDDLRVMLSNPFPFAINYSQSLVEAQIAQQSPVIGFVSNSSALYFNSDNNAYVYNGASGGFEVVSAGTPGFVNPIEPGRAYFSRFSDVIGVFEYITLKHTQPEVE